MSVTNGPRRGVMIDALTGDSFDADFRTFLRAIDALLMCNVLSKSLSAPPGSPANGDAYIVAGSPTGAWAGHANAIAIWTTDNPAAFSGEWEFYPAANGMMVYNVADTAVYFWNGTAWTGIALRSPVGVVASLDLATQSADVGSTLLYTVPAGSGGLYRISAYAVVTQAATTSSTLPYTVITFTDADTNTSNGSYISGPNATNLVGGTNSTNEGLNKDSCVVSAKAGSTISVSTSGYASVGGTPMQFGVHFRLEYLG